MGKKITIAAVSVLPRPECGHAPAMSRLRLPFSSDSASTICTRHKARRASEICRNAEQHSRIARTRNDAVRSYLGAYILLYMSST